MVNIIKKLWFHIYSDYRYGENIYIYDKPYVETEEESHEDNAPEEAFEVAFTLPKKGYRIYLINEYPNYNSEPLWFKDLDKNDDYEKIYKKMFSQIHGCMPFVSTGYNVAYKEEGYYPEISNEIISFEDIEIINTIKKNIEDIYFICVLNNKGDQIFTKMLTIF